MKKNEVEAKLRDKGIDITFLANKIGVPEDILKKELEQEEIPEDVLRKIEDAYGGRITFFGNNNEIGNSNNCCTGKDATIAKLLEMLERKDGEIQEIIDRKDKEIKELTDKIIILLEDNRQK